MPAFPRCRFWRSLRYRLSVLGACLAYLLVTLEIPLPVCVHKNSRQPFPCQDHLCGCQTAEQCWSHCCCFTAEERWAWAKAHNVEPPAYAEKPAEKPVAEGWNTPKLRDRGKHASKPAPSCCSVSRGRSACCASSASIPVTETPATSKTVGWATTLSAWRCQGYATVWVSSGSVLPVLAVTWTADEAPPAAVGFVSVHAKFVSPTPPDPPPRLSPV